jgi:hypothetical protein
LSLLPPFLFQKIVHFVGATLVVARIALRYVMKAKYLTKI